MGSSHILFQVLHTRSALSAKSRLAGSSDSYFEKGDNPRQLAQGLDHESAALTMLRLENSWRSRYRRCDLEFSFPNSVEGNVRPWDHLKHNFSSARFSFTGSFILFAVTDSTESAQAGSQTNTVLFYHVSRLGKPAYVGSIPGPRGHAVIKAVHLSEIERGRSWVGTIQIGESFLSFSIKLRQDWLKNSSPYILTPLDNPNGQRTPVSLLEEGKSSLAVRKEAASSSKKPWRLLLHISTLSSGHDEHGKPQRPYYVAARSDTDELWIVGFDVSQSGSGFINGLETDFSTYDGIQSIASSAILSPPHQGSLYRNVVVAPSLLHDSLLRVDVIWQLRTQTMTDSSPELYYYDLYKTPNGISLPHMKYGYIQGKRISSLGWRIGGFCESSPKNMRSDNTPAYFNDAQFTLGGMELIQSPGRLRDCEEQKLVVWGPSNRDDTNQVTLFIFDLSYADPKKMEYMKKQCTGFTPSGRPNSAQESFNEVCACSLHDHGYRVVLPDLWQREAPGEKALPTLMRWLQRGAGSTSPDLSAGSVELYESAARVEALARNEEVLRERIREMKRTPMTDEEVAQEWQGAWWTKWNAVVKPDGWRSL